jgi:hypothetical protein
MGEGSSSAPAPEIVRTNTNFVQVRHEAAGFIAVGAWRS